MTTEQRFTTRPLRDMEKAARAIPGVTVRRHFTRADGLEQETLFVRHPGKPGHTFIATAARSEIPRCRLPWRHHVMMSLPEVGITDHRVKDWPALLQRVADA